MSSTRLLEPGEFSGLRGEWLGARRFKLSEPLWYHSHYGAIVVPSRFVTDFDSVPRLPLAYWLVKGRFVKAPVIHDFLYATGRIGSVVIKRSVADQVFLQAMADEGGPAWARRLAWAGVRAGGWKPWRLYRSGKAQASYSRFS